MAAGELDKEEDVDLKVQDVPKEKRTNTNQVVINDDTSSQKDSVMFSSSDKVEEATAKNDHNDHHTDGKSENATEVPQLMIDPALPTEEVPQLKIDPALPPEEFTQYLIQHLEGLNLHTDSTSTEPVVDVDLWDFAGQHLYYASHPVFLSRRAIYLLVCNLSKDLNGTAEPCVRQGIHDVRLENPNGQTNLDDLLSWLVSVSGTCPTKQERAEKELPYLRPPVFIVGTHADKPCQEIEKMELQIQKEISKKYCSGHVIRPFISIDNTRSSSDSGVGKLQTGVMKVLKQEPYIGEEVPARWFNFEKVVEALVAEKTYYLTIQQLETIAQKVCFIEDKDELTTMLDFYHDLGQIIKHRSTVVLEAQWLIDVFKQLITIRPFHDMDPRHSKYWEDLESKGVLNMEFVDHVFSKFQRQGLVKEDILDMMEKFGLIARFATSPTDVKYFVPAQLKASPEGVCKMEPSSTDPCSLYLYFVDGVVPHGLFTQLVSKSISWCSENGCTQPPNLYQNGAWFVIGKQIIHDLVLTSKMRFIKIVVRQRTQSHRVSRDKSVEVATLVRKFLESTLQELSQELSYLSGLQYQFCVACPYCLQGSRKCSKHSQISCTHEECLHFLEIKPGQQLICMEDLCDKVYSVHGMEKWFSESVSQESSHSCLPVTSEDTSVLTDKAVFDSPNPLRSGKPSDEDLQHLASEIYDCWKVLGRQLKLTEAQLIGINHEEECMYEKCYRMLRKWTETYSSDADFETLARALEHNLVQRKDLASKYCYTCKEFSQVCHDVPKSAQVFEDLRQMRLDVDQVSKGTDLSLDLKMAALDKGFSISDNQGSGNCLFYALSEQLKLVKGIEIPHEELRSKLVQYLKENPKTLDGTDLFNFVNGYQSWADYLTNMKQDGTWGDHVILYAAANCYETCIHVVSSLSHLNDVIIRPSRHVDDRNPLMLGHIHEIHYVSLQPKQGHSRKRFQDESFVGQETQESAKRLKTD